MFGDKSQHFCDIFITYNNFAPHVILPHTWHTNEKTKFTKGICQICIWGCLSEPPSLSIRYGILNLI